MRAKTSWLLSATWLLGATAATAQSFPCASVAPEVRERVREAGRGLRVFAVGPNISDAIVSCRHARARTEARYDAAMLRELPAEVRGVLATHLGRLRDEMGELNQLFF